MLRWARKNGCPWTDATRDMAAGKLGYTDNLGKLVGYGIAGSDEDDEA